MHRQVVYHQPNRFRRLICPCEVADMSPVPSGSMCLPAYLVRWRVEEVLLGLALTASANN